MLRAVPEAQEGLSREFPHCYSSQRPPRKKEVSSSAKRGNTHKQRGDPVDAVWRVQGRRTSAGDHNGPHHTVPQTASQYRCTLRKRFVCHQRPHATWRSKLNNILWNQTRLLDPCLQIG